VRKNSVSEQMVNKNRIKSYFFYSVTTIDKRKIRVAAFAKKKLTPIKGAQIYESG
jgi:hypothetical protein